MQILGTSLALIFAAAWTAEASTDVCHAGGQCEPPRVAAHAMLQTSKSSDKQKELSHMKGMTEATERIYSKVQAMVSDIVATKHSVSPGEQAVIELMNATLENTTVPAIRQGHADDQVLMSSAGANLMNCETNLNTDTSSASEVKGEVDRNAFTHVTCRSDESTVETAKSQKWSSLTTFHGNLDIPSLPADVTSMDGFFSQVLNWVTTQNATYTTKKSEFDIAENDYGSKHLLCNQAQSAYEGSFCQWHTLASSAVSSHETCWSGGNTSFSLTKATVLDSADQRQAEYTGVRKIQCLLNVISGDIQGTQGRLDACTNVTVDTSFLELVNTSMPSKSLPDLGNLTLKPGDFAWESQEYSGLAINAAATPVTACAGVGTTTQAATTSATTTAKDTSGGFLSSGLYMIESGVDDSCLIFSSNGGDQYPSRHNWGEGDYCGFPEQNGMSQKDSLIANKQAVWEIVPIQGSKYYIIKSTVDDKCLIFGGNGLEQYPSRYNWGEGDYCGFPEQNGMNQTDSLTANEQAVWEIQLLTGDRYMIKSTTHEGKCLIFGGNGLEQYPSRYNWGEGDYCGFPEQKGTSQKDGLIANKQAVWIIQSLA